MESEAGGEQDLATEREGWTDIGIERWEDWTFFCNGRI